jgi:hypothetical protein
MTEIGEWKRWKKYELLGLIWGLQGEKMETYGLRYFTDY